MLPPMGNATYSSRDARRLSGLLGDLAGARGLLAQLVLRDIRVRYRYTAVGVLWAVLEPLALMAVLAFVFSFVLADRADFARGAAGAPYAVFLLTGLVFWQFTAASLTHAAASILDNRNLVKKVRFPREVLPLAALGYPLVNLCIGVFLLLALHLLLGGQLSASLLWLPPLFGIQLLLTAGLAMLLACGNVHFRDVGYILAVALLLGFYATPILYPSTLVSEAKLPEWMVWLYHMNPMSGLIESYRAAVFGGTPSLALLLWPLGVAFAAATAGLLTFRRLSPTLSDHL
jgi:lipopolysaccharide transport system permease protein